MRRASGQDGLQIPFPPHLFAPYGPDRSGLRGQPGSPNPEWVRRQGRGSAHAYPLPRSLLTEWRIGHGVATRRTCMGTDRLMPAVLSLWDGLENTTPASSLSGASGSLAASRTTAPAHATPTPFLPVFMPAACSPALKPLLSDGFARHSRALCPLRGTAGPSRVRRMELHSLRLFHDNTHAYRFDPPGRNTGCRPAR